MSSPASWRKSAIPIWRTMWHSQGAMFTPNGGRLLRALIKFGATWGEVTHRAWWFALSEDPGCSCLRLHYEVTRHHGAHGRWCVWRVIHFLPRRCTGGRPCGWCSRSPCCGDVARACSFVLVSLHGHHHGAWRRGAPGPAWHR